MGALVFLALLFVTGGLGQVIDPDLQTPPGTLGPLCAAEQRYCISGATCNARGHCQCPNSGYGLIDCSQAGWVHCHVCGDPNIVAYGGATSAVPIPCTYRMSSFTQTATGGTTCNFNIFATNEFLFGRYYVQILDMRIAVKTASSVRTYKYVVHRDTLFVRC